MACRAALLIARNDAIAEVGLRAMTALAPLMGATTALQHIRTQLACLF
jgi:hypothetical protein